MRRLPCVGLAVIAFSVSPLFAQVGAFRFFLDTKGVGEQEPRPANAPLSFTNPDVTGTGRVYLYLEYHDDNTNESGLELMLNISGPAHFTGGQFYNHRTLSGGVLHRWQAVTGAISPTPGSTSWAIHSAFGIGAAGYGVRNNDGGGNGGPDIPGGWAGTQLADTHYRHDDGSAYGTTLLGFTDMAYTGLIGDPAAELRYSVTGPGCGVIPCDRWVCLGFNDPAVPYGQQWRTSLLADALIHAIPEPSSLVVASVPIAAWVVLRARRSRRRRSS